MPLPLPCPDPDPTARGRLHADGFYHVGHAFLSDRANHIHALLEARGYARYESELFFEWRNYTAADLRWRCCSRQTPTALGPAASKRCARWG